MLPEEFGTNSVLFHFQYRHLDDNLHFIVVDKMNCPSRTDDTLLHDEWNQNPRMFSPELTTRQDLNGISNIRENKNDEPSPGLLQGSCNWKGTLPLGEKAVRNQPGAGREASLTLSGMAICDEQLIF